MAADNPFTNIVVLMLENHSFDHRLGWFPGIGTLKKNTQYNEDLYGTRIYATRGANAAVSNLADRDHSTAGTLRQLYGNEYVAPGGQPAGQWFVKENFPSIKRG